MARPVPHAPRTDFGEPPPGYVAGVGRGAVGFTTRSDIGPARQAEPERGQLRHKVQQAPSLPAPAAGGEKETDLSESRYDEFAGYQEALFADDVYTEEDKEADKTYDGVDDYVDQRRKRRREEQARKDEEQMRKVAPRIAEGFRDLKKGLSTLTEEDWMKIPEPLDYTRRNRLLKKDREKQYDRLSAAPDSLIASMIASAQPAATVEESGAATPAHDLAQLGRAREEVIRVRLDRKMDSVTGTTNINPESYMSHLNAVRAASLVETGDIDRSRTLLTSIRETNPNYPPGWIGAARLEAEAGKLVRARQIILEACEKCPTSEDVWLEAARLHTPQNAATILARAVRAIPQSVNIWLAARDLEQKPEARRAVLRRALDLMPFSERLWKAAVEEEEPEDARVLLTRAVECVPQSVDLWLALAKLETYQNAKKVLNSARKALPAEPLVWITAAKLEEANGNVEHVKTIIRHAVKSMQQQSVVIPRDTWLKHAEMAEQTGSRHTCHAIVRTAIGLGVEQQDHRNAWLHDAEQFIVRGSFECARATYEQLVEEFPTKANIWRLFAKLEKAHGSREALEAVLERAVKSCPRDEELWLMWARERWASGDMKGARQILSQAFAANEGSEGIWLAAAELESENNENDRARALLAHARVKSNTERVWRTSALLERRLGNREAEQSLLRQGLDKFPASAKMWMMLGQHYEHLPVPDLEAAREAFRQGLRHCPDSAPLFLCLARLERRAGSLPKARAVLETARVKLPTNEQLWLESVRVEQRHGNAQMAEQLMAKALRACPLSGLLWAHHIASAPAVQRKGRINEALKACGESAHVCLSAAKQCWQKLKKSKARAWFERAVASDRDLGDAWAYWLKFELENGSEEEQKRVVARCEEAAPRHGELWVSVSKDYQLRRKLATSEVLQRAAAKISQHFPIYLDGEP